MLPLRLGVPTHPASNAAAPATQSLRMSHLDMAIAMSIVGAAALRYYPGNRITKLELYFFDFVH
jgi:hypothetical protein